MAQDLGQEAVLDGDLAPVARVAHGQVGHPTHAVAVVVAPGEQARAGRRAQGGGVEVGQPHASGGQGVDHRRVDVGAVAAQLGEAHVVEHDQHHVGRARRRLRASAATTAPSHASPFRSRSTTYVALPAAGVVGDHEGVPAAMLRTFRAGEFDPARLVDEKAGRLISVCLPARDEEETVGAIVEAIRSHLMEQLAAGRRAAGHRRPLDRSHRPGGRPTPGPPSCAPTRSSPATGTATARARRCGSRSTPPAATSSSGATPTCATSTPPSWSACSDPLLTRPDVAFVKGFYERPPSDGPTGAVGSPSWWPDRWCRCSSRSWPPFVQPLAGEYAGRREIARAAALRRGLRGRPGPADRHRGPLRAGGHGPGRSRPAGPPQPSARRALPPGAGRPAGRPAPRRAGSGGHHRGAGPTRPRSGGGGRDRAPTAGRGARVSPLLGLLELAGSTGGRRRPPRPRPGCRGGPGRRPNRSTSEMASIHWSASSKQSPTTASTGMSELRRPARPRRRPSCRRRTRRRGSPRR